MAPQNPKQQSVPFTGSWAKVKSANAKMKQQLMDGQHVVAWVGCTVQSTWLFTTPPSAPTWSNVSIPGSSKGFEYAIPALKACRSQSGTMQNCCIVICHSTPLMIFVRPFADCTLDSQYSSKNVSSTSCSWIDAMSTRCTRPTWRNLAL